MIFGRSANLKPLLMSPSSLGSPISYDAVPADLVTTALQACHASASEAAARPDDRLERRT